MREILFRGKRIDNSEWVCSRSILTVFQDNKYLLFIPQQGEDFKAEPNERNGRILTITKGNYYQVDYKTIGQYTGLTANGKKIFEGDIIKSEQDETIGVIRFGEYQTTNSGNGECHLGFSIEWYGKYSDIIRRDLGWWINTEIKNIEIIGNIHDNPELLEVE